MTFLELGELQCVPRGTTMVLTLCFRWSSYLPSYKTCDVIAIPAKYDSKYVSFGYQKHSPYQGLFDHYIREIKEKGALKQILNKYETDAPVCPDGSGKPLGFESCFTAFLVLLTGSIIFKSSAIFLEYLIIFYRSCFRSLDIFPGEYEQVCLQVWKSQFTQIKTDFS